MSLFPSAFDSTGNAPGFRRVFVLRCAVHFAQAVIVVAAGFWLNGPPPAAILIAVGCALVVSNLTSWRALGSRKPAPEVVFPVQLAIDIAVLGLLLYYAGGATNPFVWLLLLSITVAATVLTRRQTWLIALLGAGVYSLLMWFYRPLPGVHLPTGSGFALHVIGMWAGFIFSAFLIAHFVAGMAANVRIRDRALARAREQALRDERLVSLGALAASAAHELGTPLGTLTVLADDLAMDIDTGAADAARRKLDVMAGQLRRCKQAIATLVSSAGTEAAQSGRAIDIATFLDATIAEWRARRADVRLRCHFNDEAPRLRLVAEQQLASALVNVFDNAADASPGDVEIYADWNDDALAIRVDDRGPGFAPELRDRVGKAPVSHKGRGHGLGLYLTQGIIDRLGGRLHIRPRSGGGTSVEVQLPLTALKV